MQLIPPRLQAAWAFLNGQNLHTCYSRAALLAMQQSHRTHSSMYQDFLGYGLHTFHSRQRSVPRGIAARAAFRSRALGVHVWLGSAPIGVLQTGLRCSVQPLIKLLVDVHLGVKELKLKLEPTSGWLH